MKQKQESEEREHAPRVELRTQTLQHEIDELLAKLDEEKRQHAQVVNNLITTFNQYRTERESKSNAQFQQVQKELAQIRSR